MRPTRVVRANQRRARDRRPLVELLELNGPVRAAARDGGR